MYPFGEIVDYNRRMQPLNRRGFLQSGIAVASALALDPERLLWTPGAKTIFIPPPPKVVSGGGITEADGLNVTLLAGEKYYRTTDGRVLTLPPVPDGQSRMLNFSNVPKPFFNAIGHSDGVFYIRSALGLYLKNM